MAIDPNIPLQVKSPDVLGNAANYMALNKAALDYQTAKATQAATIQQANVAAQKAQFGLTQEQYQNANNFLNSIAQDPNVVAAAKETDPAKRKQLSQNITEMLLQHRQNAIDSGTPEQLVDRAITPYLATATLHPERVQQLVAQHQQAFIGPAGQVTMTQVPAGTQQTIKLTNAGQPYIEAKDQFGNVSQIPINERTGQPIAPKTATISPGQSSAPSGIPSGATSYPATKPITSTGGVHFRSPEEQARIENATKEIEQIRFGGQLIPQTKQSIGQILNLLDTDTKFGKGSKQWNDAMAYLHTLTGGKVGDNSTNYQEANAYIDRLIQQQVQAAGTGSVAGQNLVAGATGNVDTMNPEALKEKMRNLRGLIAGNEAYRKGLDYTVGVGERQNPARKSAFDAKFADAWDTDLFRMKEAIDNNDREELQKIGSKHSPAEWKAKWQKLNNVVPGYIPNYWAKK